MKHEGVDNHLRFTAPVVAGEHRSLWHLGSEHQTYPLGVQVLGEAVSAVEIRRP